MIEVIDTQQLRIDDVVGLFFGLLRPQGPPPTGQGQELTMGQFRVLIRLRHDGPATMGSIARAAGCSLQSATALIERVQRQGLVERERGHDDRRIVECRLTERGRSLVDEIAGHRKAALRQALDVLDPDELGQLHGLLLSMVERQQRAAPAVSRSGAVPAASPAAAPIAPMAPIPTGARA